MKAEGRKNKRGRRWKVEKCKTVGDHEREREREIGEGLKWKWTVNVRSVQLLVKAPTSPCSCQGPTRPLSALLVVLQLLLCNQPLYTSWHPRKCACLAASHPYPSTASLTPLQDDRVQSVIARRKQDKRFLYARLSLSLSLLSRLSPRAI